LIKADANVNINNMMFLYKIVIATHEAWNVMQLLTSIFENNLH
jgi:hypothetical protein